MADTRQMTKRHDLPHHLLSLALNAYLAKRESQRAAGSRELQHMAVTRVMTSILTATRITSTPSN
jgi:hypothetical protein